MKKAWFAVLVLCLWGHAAGAADLQGKGRLTGSGGECSVASSSISNIDGDVSFRLDATCGGNRISGTLADASAVGDNASIRYYGNLSVNGERLPAEIFLTLTPEGSEAAVACGGQVWDLGKTTLK